MTTIEDKKAGTTYFKHHVKYLNWAGCNIYEYAEPNKRLYHKIYSIVLLSLFGYGYIFTEILHIIKHISQLEEVTLTLCYLIPHFIASGKLVVLSLRKHQVSKFISSLEEGVFRPDIKRGGMKEYDIVNAAIKQTNIQARFFGIVVLCMLSSRIFPCLMKSSKTIFDPVKNETFEFKIFPYPSTLPFSINTEKSPFYEIVFFYQSFCIALFGIYLGTTDTIITGLMIHVKAQFKIIINSVANLVERAETITYKKIPTTNTDYFTIQKNGQYLMLEAIPKFEKLYAKNLKICVDNCIKHHYKILQLVKNMEDTFSLILLIQFLGSLFSICVGLYQISLLPITDPTCLSMCSYSTAMLFQLLIYCWNGNEISLYSEDVASAAFCAKWVQADRGIKMSLLLMILRAQRPCWLTAGKFSNISLETFVAIVKGSVSYFMVLRQANEEISK